MRTGHNFYFVYPMNLDPFYLFCPHVHTCACVRACVRVCVCVRAGVRVCGVCAVRHKHKHTHTHTHTHTHKHTLHMYQLLHQLPGYVQFFQETSSGQSQDQQLDPVDWLFTQTNTQTEVSTRRSGHARCMHSRG